VVVDASLSNVFDTRVAVVDGQTLPRVGVRITVVESADTGEDSATISGSMAEATTDAEGSFTVQLPRGFYGIEAEVGSEILRAVLAIDLDVYGAQRVALVPTPKFQPVESDTH